MLNSNHQTSQESFLSTGVDTAAYEKILKQNNFAGRTVGEVLTAISSIQDNTEKGLKFEKLTQWALPLAKSAEIKSVIKPRGQDIGADLIATSTSGHEIAIQCKFYTSRNIQRNDFLTFLAAAKRKKIKTKWLVCGGKGISDDAKDFTKDYGIQIVDLRQYGNTKLTTKPQETRSPLPLQKEAIDAVVQGFTNAKSGEHGERRGKLIMACGTGKTFTALRIAEKLAPDNANILFIAPSIALVAQARKEWLEHTTRPLRTLIICSDQTAGHDEDIQPNEITGRVTTAPEEIAGALGGTIKDGAAQATFCTYQSLDKLLEAQTKHGAPKFDLAIVDEAHRTTGLLTEGDEGQFLLIHDAGKIEAGMRLYMTATPRIYKDSVARRRAEQDPSIAVVDMNDAKRYGNQFYHLTFKQAVDNNLLCDYRVIALGVSEAVIGHQLTNSLLALNDEVGEGLPTRTSKKGNPADAQSVLALGAISLAINGFIKGELHPDSIARTIAFANNIRRSRWLERALQDPQMKGWVTRTGRRDSESAKALTIDARHLDGTSSASARYDALNWLRDGSASSPRLITNAQLFTEGVDVPALNAIAFLDPRRSKIDTVQAVGRVMRRDPDNPGKVHGYIIVPVIIPPGSNLLKTLDTDKARFQSLGNVMRALRSHDERFDTDLHLLLGEVTSGGGKEKIPPIEVGIQQSLLDDKTKQAIFAQLAKGTGIGNAGKNTADGITIAINRAAAILEAGGAAQLIAKTIGTPSNNAEESCKTAALLIANACIMHKRLDETGNLGDLAKIETANTDANPPEALHRAWRTILQKDYSPIFQDAALLVKRMAPLSKMHDAIHVLIECAMSSASTLNDLGFDHAGHLYHRVLGTAQSDGAFYTKNLSAYLLAGLTFNDDFADWKDMGAVKRLRVADPACGTGTLLMAALNTIKRKAAKAQNLTAEQTEALHKHLVENSIHGFDINKYSIQLAACNLTIGAPNTDYSGMNLHTLQHGPLPDTDGDKPHLVRHGALEILLGETGKELLQNSIADSEGMYSSDAMRKKQSFKAPFNLDAVIYNPPFTETVNQSKKYTAQTKKAMTDRLRLIKETLKQQDPATANALSQRTIGPFFTPLTTGLLSKDKGKLAKIIPATACVSENGRAERQYIANNFHIEMVVTSHDPKRINFSENTSIHECLVIGKRSENKSKPTRFIQLVKYPDDVKAAERLIEKIHSGEGGDLYSETVWAADKMRAGDWTPVQWYNPELARIAGAIDTLPKLIISDDAHSLTDNPTSVMVNFVYTPDSKGNAFCTIAENIMKSIQAKPESKATPKKGKKRKADAIWKDKKYRLLITSRFSTTSSRLLAIYSKTPAISSAYFGMKLQSIELEKVFAAFLNSSFGVIQMLNRRTRKLTYPNYEVGHLKTLKLPDPNKADLAPLLAAFEKVKDTPLQRLAHCAEDPARKILDHAAANALGVDPAITDQWREWLSQEPTITNRPYQPHQPQTLQ